MLQSLEPLLNDSNAQIRREVPALLGALGAAQAPELRGFFAWVFDAAQRTSSAPEKRLWGSSCFYSAARRARLGSVLGSGGGRAAGAGGGR